MTWRRWLLPIALAVFTSGCAIPQPQTTPEKTIQLTQGGLYTVIYSCINGLGCAGEVVQIADGPHDGWVLLTDGRVLNLRQVLAIMPFEPPAEEPEESSPALRVKL